MYTDIYTHIHAHAYIKRSTNGSFRKQIPICVYRFFLSSRKTAALISHALAPFRREKPFCELSRRKQNGSLIFQLFAPSRSVLCNSGSYTQTFKYLNNFTTKSGMGFYKNDSIYVFLYIYILMYICTQAYSGS